MEDPVPLEAEGGQGGLGRSDIVIRGSQAVWGSPEDSGEESVGSRRLPESSGRFRRRARRLGEVPCVNTYRAPTAERRVVGGRRVPPPAPPAPARASLERLRCKTKRPLGLFFAHHRSLQNQAVGFGLVLTPPKPNAFGFVAP